MPKDRDLKIAVIEALNTLQDQVTGKKLLDTDLIAQIDVVRGRVNVRLENPTDREREERIALEDLIYQTIDAVDGVSDATIEVFSKQEEDDESAAPDDADGHQCGHHGEHGHHEGHGHQCGGHGHGDHGHGGGGGHQCGGHGRGHGGEHAEQASSGGLSGQQEIEGVDCVIAVASGKGGVGKSTVACNLALALNALGYKAGLLDVDIYGPSIPTLLGIEGQPEIADGRILPMKAHGLSAMSIGFLLKDDSPAIWRGPIVTSIIRQFLKDVDWRGTQYLILDLPPGTGDAQLTVTQSVPLDGAIVVTTPSDLALLDAARGLQMFNALNVEVLGIVENMSYFICPNCDEKHHIFGEGGGSREAERLGTRLLGEIPLAGEIRTGGDNGSPIVAVAPESPQARAFIELAASIVELKPLEPAEPDKKKKGIFSFLRS